MPIRPDLKHFYGAEWRQVVRPPILKRAGGRLDDAGAYLGGARCEQCGKPDRSELLVANWSTGSGPQTLWAPAHSHAAPWRNQYGEFATWRRPSGCRVRIIKVVLSVVHLNHVPGDDRAENLMALCQWCHLHYDAMSHRETREKRKDRSRPLLAREAM